MMNVDVCISVNTPGQGQQHVVSAPPIDAAGGIMAVFDLLAAAVGVRSPRGFANAAEKRHGLQDKNMGAIPVMKGHMQVIDNLRNTCRRR